MKESGKVIQVNKLFNINKIYVKSQNKNCKN